MHRVSIFVLMMLSRFRVALLFPLAFGCAHAVYNGQPDGSEVDNSVTDQPVTSHAGAANMVLSRAGAGNSAGSPSLGAGGAQNRGAPSAGASSAGAPSAGAPSVGAPSAGAANGGAESGGAANGGSGGTSCSGVSAWKLIIYSGADLVQAGGQLYKCKSGAESGWCGLADAYAPGTGYAWTAAWDLVGPC